MILNKAVMFYLELTYMEEKKPAAYFSFSTFDIKVLKWDVSFIVR